MTAQAFTSLLQTSSSFPTAAMTLESSVFLNYLTAGVLFATFAFLVRTTPNRQEKENIEKEESKEDELEKKKTEDQPQLVTADGVAWRLAGGSLFLGLRAKHFDLRAAGGAGLLFPPAAGTANVTMNAPTGVQLLTLSVLLALAGLLVRSAKKEEDVEQKEKAPSPETEKPQEETSPEKKMKKKSIELVSFDGVAMKLAAGLLLLAVRVSWAPILAALRAASSSAAFPPPMLAMETPAPVCLLSLAVLCFGITAVIRSSEAEEKDNETEERTKEKEAAPRQHKVVSVDGTALRLGACCWLFGIYEAAKSTGILSTLRATFRTTSFPHPMLAMETPAFVCLLSLAALCFGFTAVIRSSEAEEKENKKQDEAAEKEAAPRQHKVVSVDGTALRLGACCGLFGIYEAAMSTGLLSTLRATFHTPSFPPPMLAMETPAFVCLLSLAALCFGFTAVIRSSEMEEKENKKQDEATEKEAAPRQHKVVSVDGTALRLGACCGLFGMYEAVKTTSFLPALRTVLGSDELAMSAGMLIFGTGLLLTEHTRGSAKKVQ